MHISQPLISCNSYKTRKQNDKPISLNSSNRHFHLDTSSPFKQMSKSVISKKYAIPKPQFNINSKEIVQNNPILYQNSTNSAVVRKQSTRDHLANYSSNSVRKGIQFSMHVSRLSGKPPIGVKGTNKSIISNNKIEKCLISENYSNQINTLSNDKINNSFGNNY